MDICQQPNLQNADLAEKFVFDVFSILKEKSKTGGIIYGNRTTRKKYFNFSHSNAKNLPY
jgi:hypothetical protein